MIEPDDTIRFQPDDVPDTEGCGTQKKPRRRRKPVEPPADFRPFGYEW